MKVGKKRLHTFACFRQTPPSSLLLPLVQPRCWKMQEGGWGWGPTECEKLGEREVAEQGGQ